MRKPPRDLPAAPCGVTFTTFLTHRSSGAHLLLIEPLSVTGHREAPAADRSSDAGVSDQ